MELKDEHSALAVVIVKEKSQRRILMLKNRMGWVFPKGHIEEGEDEETAARRECLEETGVNINSAVCYGKVNEYVVIIDHTKMRLTREEFKEEFGVDSIRKTISAYCFELKKKESIIVEEGFIEGQWISEFDAFRILAYPESKVSLIKSLSLIDKTSV